MRRLLPILALAVLLAGGCGIYSFSGTSIQPDEKTVTINLFEYKALKVNPSLANELTEALRNKFRRMTRLEQVDIDGDLEIVGEVTGYDVRAQAVTAGEVAALNRLTVTINVTYINRKNPDSGFEKKSFSAYSDFDSNQGLESVESTLCTEIIEKLIEDVFNATVAQW